MKIFDELKPCVVYVHCCPVGMNELIGVFYLVKTLLLMEGK